MPVIPSRAHGEGPHERSPNHTKKAQPAHAVDAVRIAKALDPLRGPSPSARLGMTSKN